MRKDDSSSFIVEAPSQGELQNLCIDNRRIKGKNADMSGILENDLAIMHEKASPMANTKQAFSSIK